MRFSPDNFEGEFENALRLLTDAMPPAEELSKPTLLHNIRVAIYLYTRGYNRDICLAGLLHDAVEDTSITLQEIKNAFGERAALLVDANTKNDQMKDKMEKYRDMMSRCIQTGEGAAVIKAADILDNFYYFSKIGDHEKTAWMITTGTMLLKILPDTYEDPIFKELERVLQKGK